jgi:hypothetical protein
MGQILGAYSLTPFSSNLISFFHGHAGVLSEHLRSSPTSPGEEIEKMVFADGLGAGRRIDFCLTSLD